MEPPTRNQPSAFISGTPFRFLESGPRTRPRPNPDPKLRQVHYHPAHRTPAPAPLSDSTVYYCSIDPVKNLLRHPRKQEPGGSPGFIEKPRQKKTAGGCLPIKSLTHENEGNCGDGVTPPSSPSREPHAPLIWNDSCSPLRVLPVCPHALWAGPGRSILAPFELSLGPSAIQKPAIFEVNSLMREHHQYLHQFAYRYNQL